MQKIVFLIFLILFGNLNLLAQTKLTREEYAVYATVLKIIYKENRETYSNKSHFVILKETGTDSDFDSELNYDRQHKNLVQDFNRKNSTPTTVERYFPRGAYSETYYLVSQTEIDELFEKGQVEFDKRYEKEKSNKFLLNPGGTTWTPFYEKYPEASGYYTLSRVGFNKQFAMVKVKREDVSSGFSRTYILKKVKGKWRVFTSGGGEWVA